MSRWLLPPAGESLVDAPADLWPTSCSLPLRVLRLSPPGARLKKGLVCVFRPVLVTRTAFARWKTVSRVPACGMRAPAARLVRRLERRRRVRASVWDAALCGADCGAADPPEAAAPEPLSAGKPANAAGLTDLSPLFIFWLFWGARCARAAHVRDYSGLWDYPRSSQAVMYAGRKRRKPVQRAWVPARPSDPRTRLLPPAERGNRTRESWCFHGDVCGFSRQMRDSGRVMDVCGSARAAFIQPEQKKKPKYLILQFRF